MTVEVDNSTTPATLTVTPKDEPTEEDTPVVVTVKEANGGESVEVSVTVEASECYSIEREGVKSTYLTLKEAVDDSASEGETIVVEKSTSRDKETVEVNKNLTLNLQDNILTRTTTITVNDGYTLNIIGTGKINNTSEAAITNNGIVNIGETTGDLSDTAPQIIGETYGINSTGIWNLYNGIVEGKSAGYNVEPNKTRVRTVITTGTDGSYKTGYLSTAYYSITKSGVTTGYQTLQTAIGGVTANDQTIKLLDNISDTSAATISRYNTILDLQKYTITRTSAISVSSKIFTIKGNRENYYNWFWSFSN